MKFSKLLTESQSEYKKNLAKWNADAKKEFESQRKTVEEWTKKLVKMLGTDFSYEMLNYFDKHSWYRKFIAYIKFKEDSCISVKFRIEPNEDGVYWKVICSSFRIPELTSFNKKAKADDLEKSLSSALDHFTKIRKKLLIAVLNKIKIDGDKLDTEIKRIMKRAGRVDSQFVEGVFRVYIVYYDEKLNTEMSPLAMMFTLNTNIDYRRGQRVLSWSGGSDREYHRHLKLSVPKTTFSDTDEASAFLVKWLKSKTKDVEDAIDKWIEAKEKSWGR